VLNIGCTASRIEVETLKSIAFALCVTIGMPLYATEPTREGEGTVESDFAFLVGNWTVEHRRLVGRLVGSAEWTEFETHFENRSLLNGRANMDKLWGNIGDEYFEGISVRTLEAENGEWTIYWMDTTAPVLTEQVRGHFNGDFGEFFGVDDIGERSVQLRFIWRRITKNHAQWEQAYRDPESNYWETNWVMDFHRKTDPS